MNLDDLAVLMGKTKEEVREILEHNEIIELNLTEKKTKEAKENGKIESLE